MHRIAAFILVLFMGSFAGAALAQTEPAASPISLAGEQRMLAQRIAKLYSQIGLNVMPSVAVSQLILATRRFESNLATLQPTAAGSADVRQAHQRLDGAWQNMKQGLATAVSREAAVALARQAEATLVAAEHLTRVIEDQSKSVDSRLINLAGRQRMMSQRIANNYLLRSWGIESSAVREALASSTNDFSAGLAQLRGRQDNSEALQRELEEVAQQWEWLQASLSVEGTGDYRLIVAESADAILEATDRISALYEKHSQR